MNWPTKLLLLVLGMTFSIVVRAQQTDEQRMLHGGPAPNRHTRELMPDEEVRPSATDPNIQTFDYPHAVYFPAQNRLRNQLLLFIPGTQPHDKKGDPEKPSAIRFCKNAAVSGYHVVYLMYPNDVAAAEACRDKPDPDAFSLFRWALIEGGSNAYISVPRSESIENRATKLMLYLQHEHPNQNWGQFVVNGQVAWEKVAVAGKSQGGGHAAIIATRYLVARVLCFGAPKDYSRYSHAPAKWYESSVTPMSRYFAFNNYQDNQGCSPDQQLENIKKLGIDKVGGIADVDKEPRPFHHAHVLFTNWPGTPTDSLTAHVSMIGTKAMTAAGTPLFRPVWLYMLNAPTDGTEPHPEDESPGSPEKS